MLDMAHGFMSTVGIPAFAVLVGIFVWCVFAIVDFVIGLFVDREQERRSHL